MTLPTIPSEVPLDGPAVPGSAAVTSSEVRERRVHCFDDPGDKARRALLVALGANRPLLVQGEPGVGKTQLAEAAAKALDRVFLSVTVDSRTESRDLLYSFDAARRLGEAQLIGALGAMIKPTNEPESSGADADRAAREKLEQKVAELRAELDPGNFVVPGILWWAFNHESARTQAIKAKTSCAWSGLNWKAAKGSSVVLIDEIDKAEAELPNGLLEALGSRRFSVSAGLPDVVMQTTNPPLVIITTNRERTLPDPFLRRCVVLNLELPTEPSVSQNPPAKKGDTQPPGDGLETPEPTVSLSQFLFNRGKAHFPKLGEPVLQRAAELLVRDRAQAARDQTLLPGQAEYLDLLRAVAASSADSDEQLSNLDLFSDFVFVKSDRS
jgi:MoxR-like ATPase